MNRLFTLPILFTAFAAPVYAERIEGQAQTTHVTVFPQGAVISWAVKVSASTGTHQLVLPDMPQGIDTNSLRVTSDSARIGAVAVQSSRALPGEAGESHIVTQARDRVVKAREAVVAFESDIMAIRQSAKSWEERAAVTRDLMRGDNRASLPDLRASADEAGTIIEEYLLKAGEETRKADLKAIQLGELQRELQRAEAALAAVIDVNAESQTFLITAEFTEPDTKLELSAFTAQAGWSPAYDLNLNRETGEIALDRSLQVWQESGGDWHDVTLTLSTAHPLEQPAPTEVSSYFPYLQSRDTPVVLRSAAPVMMADRSAEAAFVEPVMLEKAVLANIGMTVAYDYSTPVTVRNQADALRLSLDRKTLSTNVLAEVAPRFDANAFVVAEGKSNLEEPILPGSAMLYLDGAMVGHSQLPLIVPGDDLRIGFGSINGITAELRTPEESEGDAGFISRSNQLIQSETLIVKNHTDQEWPLRVVDRIPVSKQENLTVDWSATPEPTKIDPDGRRGVLFWEGPFKSGEVREIQLSTELNWPTDSDLIR